MGYYTYYEVSYKDESRGKDYAEKLAKINPDYFDCYYNGFALDCLEDLISADSMRWYDHDKDMLELSKAFPDELFILHGEGEENGDLWNAYYKNGKMQVCHAEFTYPQPDPFFT